MRSRLGPGPGEPYDGRLHHYKRLFVERGILLATSNNGDIDLIDAIRCADSDDTTAVSEHEVVDDADSHDAALPDRRPSRASRSGSGRSGIWTTPTNPTRRPPHWCSRRMRRSWPVRVVGDICNEWNAAGAFTLNGKLWTQPQVSTCSCVKHATPDCGATPTTGSPRLTDGKGTWPALVDESTWKAAQSVLNAPGRAPGRKTVRRHLLTGALRSSRQVRPSRGRPVDETGNDRLLLSGMPRRVDPRRACRADGVRPRCGPALTTRPICSRPSSTIKPRPRRCASNRTRSQPGWTASPSSTPRSRRRAGEDQHRCDQRFGESSTAATDQERLRYRRPAAGTARGRRRGSAALTNRAVLSVLMEITIAPVGKHGHAFNPERVKVDWR